MKQRGRKPASTREQREEVLRRVRSGESRRSVAKAVFGDEGMKGRVDRIVREDALGGRRADIESLLRTIRSDPESLAEEAAGEVPTLEQLFPFYARALRRRLADPDERVTAGELEAFARLEYRIEQKRMFEEANKITRS